MKKLIKKAQQVQNNINVGDIIQYIDRLHDGRSYENIIYNGKVVKVHRVNLDFIAENGNTIRVGRNEVRKVN